MAETQPKRNPKRGPGRPPKAKKEISWISNERPPAHPYVSIDKQQRLYISAPARELLNVPNGQFHLIAGFDHVNKRIVLAKPEVVRVTDVKPFKFDKRPYSRAKTFVEQANIEAELPVRFTYVGRDYADYKGSHAFELVTK